MSTVPDQLAAALKLCDEFSARTGTDLIIITSEIRPGCSDMLRGVCARATPNSKVVVLLSTPGGSPDEAYRMARCLRRRYQHVTVLVNEWCKSAGTLMCLGADELVMLDAAELGPLDVQLHRFDEFRGEPHSGLDLTQALRVLEQNVMVSFKSHLEELRRWAKLSTKLAAHIAQELATHVYQPIYSQVDPLRLGENHRKTLIALAYGQRLSTANVKEGALERLITAYPHHSFVIDREEAETLFQHVRSPNPDEMIILTALPARLFSVPEDEIGLVAALESQNDPKNPPEAEPRESSGTGSGAPGPGTTSGSGPERVPSEPSSAGVPTTDGQQPAPSPQDRQPADKVER